MRALIAFFSIIILLTLAGYFSIIEDTPRCDYGIEFWKKIVEKAKEHHPDAKGLKLMKYISHEITKDQNSLFTIAQIFNMNKTDFNNSLIISYAEVNLTMQEAIWFKWILLLGGKRCDYGNNMTFIMLPREWGLINLLNLYNIKNYFFNNWWNFGQVKFSSLERIFKSLKLTTMAEDSENSSNCTKAPEMLAIIDKMNKMNLTTTFDWAELGVKEFMNELKSQASTVLRSGFPDFRVSMISACDGKVKDVINWSPHFQTCVMDKASYYMMLQYVKP